MLSHLSICCRVQAALFLPAPCWAHHEKELGLIWQARGPFSLSIQYDKGESARFLCLGHVIVLYEDTPQQSFLWHLEQKECTDVYVQVKIVSSFLFVWLKEYKDIMFRSSNFFPKKKISQCQKENLQRYYDICNYIYSDKLKRCTNR